MVKVLDGMLGKDEWGISGGCRKVKNLEEGMLTDTSKMAETYQMKNVGQVMMNVGYERERTDWLKRKAGEKEKLDVVWSVLKKSVVVREHGKYLMWESCLQIC